MNEHTGHDFDKGYWERHWQEAHRGDVTSPENPYIVAELAELTPGTALDAGCGEGAEALRLASLGWRVTAADISAEVLARAAARPGAEGVAWLEADLGEWAPPTPFDLVTTFYAHPAMPQLAFYERIANWVAPGGTLLIVGHGHAGDRGHGHGEEHDRGHEHAASHGNPPPEASVTAADVAALFTAAEWEVVTAEEVTRNQGDRAGESATLRDVVVRVTRR